jgi:hypothetical protein
MNSNARAHPAKLNIDRARSSPPDMNAGFGGERRRPLEAVALRYARRAGLRLNGS